MIICLHGNVNQNSRMAKIKRLIKPSIDEDIEQLKLSNIAGGNEMV